MGAAQARSRRDLEDCANELGTTSAAVSLAWLRAREGTVVPILGARRVEHLDANLAGLEVTLTPGHLRTLDEVSAPALNYPAPMHGALRAMQNEFPLMGGRLSIKCMDPPRPPRMDPPRPPPGIAPPTPPEIMTPSPEDTRKAVVPGAPSARQRADLLAIARRLAAGHEERNPANIRYVASTREVAIAEITPSRVIGDASVYVIQMEGNFLRRKRYIDHVGKPPPCGSMTIVVDAETGQVTDLCMSSTSPDLSRLGQEEAL